MRERTGNSRITASTVFRIASMTKSFTALAILKLRDEGKLSLEDPVAIVGSRRATDYGLEVARSLARGVVIGSALTIVGLFALLVTSVAVGDAVGTFAKHNPNQPEIDVVGEHRDTTHQGTKIDQLLCHPERISVLNAPHH